MPARAAAAVSRYHPRACRARTRTWPNPDLAPIVSNLPSPTVHRTGVPTARPLRLPRVAMRRPLASLLLFAAMATAPAATRAEWLVAGDQLRVTYGPWAYHFSHSDEHADFNHLVGVELLTRRWTFWGAERATIGLALFDNSFGQFSQYLSFGQEWDLWRLGPGRVYVNVSVGLLHGYKEPYENKIPFNQFGIAPAAIPTLGWRYGPFALTASALGTNGFLFGASWMFDLRR